MRSKDGPHHLAADVYRVRKSNKLITAQIKQEDVMPETVPTDKSEHKPVGSFTKDVPPGPQGRTDFSPRNRKETL
jgi:hypothetical protein